MQVDLPVGTHMREVLAANADYLLGLFAQPEALDAMIDVVLTRLASEWNRRDYIGATAVTKGAHRANAVVLAFAPVDMLLSDAFQAWFARRSGLDAFEDFDEVMQIFARDVAAIDHAEVRMRVLHTRLCAPGVMSQELGPASMRRTLAFMVGWQIESTVQWLLVLTPAAMSIALDILLAVCNAATGPSPMQLLSGAARFAQPMYATDQNRAAVFAGGVEMARLIAQRCLAGPKWNDANAWNSLVTRLNSVDAEELGAHHEAFKAFAKALLVTGASRMTAPLAPVVPPLASKWFTKVLKKAVFDASVALLQRRAETPVKLDPAADLPEYGLGNSVWQSGLDTLKKCAGALTIFPALVPVLLALKRNPHADVFALELLLTNMAASIQASYAIQGIRGRAIGVAAMFVVFSGKAPCVSLHDAGILVYDWTTVHDLLRVSHTKSFNSWDEEEMCDAFMVAVRAASAQRIQHFLLDGEYADLDNTASADSLGAAIAFGREREATALLEFLHTWNCEGLRAGPFGSPIVRDLLACGFGLRRDSDSFTLIPADDSLRIARLFPVAKRLATAAGSLERWSVLVVLIEHLDLMSTNADDDHDAEFVADVVAPAHVPLLAAVAQWLTRADTQDFEAGYAGSVHARYFVDLVQRRRAWLLLRDAALFPPGEGGAGPAEYVRRSRSRQAHRERHAERDAWHAQAILQRDWAASMALRTGTEPPPVITLPPPAPYADVPRLPDEWQALREALQEDVERVLPGQHLPLEVEADIMALVMDIDDAAERRDLALIMRDHVGPPVDASTGLVLPPLFKRARDEEAKEDDAMRDDDAASDSPSDAAGKRARR
ncbi:MAG: hypothetical protein Q7V62_14350 [Actinomycetota bacterium]|nr:hypothetical protein [Actinomycetota bacterium]